MKEMPGQPELNRVAADLRERLALPEDWVQVFGDEHEGFVVGLALNMHLEEDGDGENGPHLSGWPTRFAYIGKNGDVWFASYYEHGPDEGYDDRPPELEIRLGAIDTVDVAPAVTTLVKGHVRFKLERD